MASPLAVVVLAIAAGMFLWQRARESRLRWVHDEALPGISRLVTMGQRAEAYRLAQQALAAAPDDPQLAAAWDAMTSPVRVTSEPEGAEVSIRSLSGKDEGWMAIGRTPLTAQLPMGQMRWLFALDGYEPREIVPNPGPETLTLRQGRRRPAGDGAGAPGRGRGSVAHSEVKVPGFWIDAFEVTNRQFKAFVDAGGYQKRDYWTTPFIEGRPHADLGRGDGRVS